MLVELLQEVINVALWVLVDECLSKLVSVASNLMLAR